MLTSPKSVLLAFAFTAALAAPALAQSRSTQYATDPDPAVHSQLNKEHQALSHTDAVLPRTKLAKGQKLPRERGPAYATDPDPRIWGYLGREHLDLNHPNAVMPRTSAPQYAPGQGGSLPYGSSLSASQPGFNPSLDRAKGYF